MGERGFEPLKAYASRFTVCPLWPLGYSPLSEAWYLPPEGRARNVGFGLKAAGRTRTADLDYKSCALPTELRRLGGDAGYALGLQGAIGLCSRWPGRLKRTSILPGPSGQGLLLATQKIWVHQTSACCWFWCCMLNRCSPVDPHESCLQNQEGGNPSTCEVLGRRSTLNTAAWRLHPGGMEGKREEYSPEI